MAKKIENLLERILGWAGENFLLFTLLFVILSFLLSLININFADPLRKDAYIYVLKALEITHGNWSPLITHAIGWPLVISLFSWLSGASSLLQSMVVARILSALFGALTLIPISLMTKKIVGERAGAIVVILTCFSNLLINSSASALAEPLFGFLLFCFLAVLCYVSENKNNLYLAAIFASLAYYVRFNGIFLVVFLALYFVYLKRKNIFDSYKPLVYAVALFFFISMPFLVQREAYFGSPFFYGENSKYFVDSYNDVWRWDVKAPSLLNYLASHNLGDYINKFFVHGFMKISFHYIYVIIQPMLLLFLLYGIFIYWKNERFVPLTIFTILWILSLIPVYDIYGDPRYLYSTIPVIIIFSVAGFSNLVKESKGKYILIGLFIFAFVLLSMASWAKDNYGSSNIYVSKGDEVWAKWAAENLHGKIAMMDGGDLIMMQLNDTQVGGNKEVLYYSPLKNITVLRPPIFGNATQAILWMYSQNITYIETDNLNNNARPYLNDIDNNLSNFPYLKELYSNYDSRATWKVRFYEINWKKYISCCA